MLGVHVRLFRARVAAIRHQSRLLLFVLVAFIVSYVGVGYWLFHSGLLYLYNFPLVGALLSQRILFLIFGFVFVMLIFSNLIIGYSTLFKNRETAWMLTLPISHHAVYRWKFLESLVVSSWALIFLSAPLMAAYGRVHSVSPLFYFLVMFSYVPFVVIPGLLGSWLIVFLVRVLAKRWVKTLLLYSAVALTLALVFFVKPSEAIESAHAQDILSFDQLLRHSRMTLNPWLPSAWLATSILAWGEGLWNRGGFFGLVLLSNALMGLLIGFEFIGRRFYTSWSVSVSYRAERSQRKALLRRERRAGEGWAERLVNLLPFMSQPVKAICLKDFRVFWRDPAQWTQFMIFFGLLCIYVLNLRNISFNFRNDFWETMISYLNLAASSLTLSTLTTRFVFPQFSLEGRRLWIIGLAPIGLRRVLRQKLWMACGVSSSITVGLMLASSLMLNLPWSKIVFFMAAIAIMSATLSSMAVALGALFPNLKEDNPSKIVSGFGGTLCLVLSFIYILCFVALLAVPAMRQVVQVQLILPDWLALSLAALISMLLGGVPMGFAMQRVKNLEF